jgi:hypothetical protein
MMSQICNADGWTAVVLKHIECWFTVAAGFVGEVAYSSVGRNSKLVPEIRFLNLDSLPSTGLQNPPLSAFAASATIDSVRYRDRIITFVANHW